MFYRKAPKEPTISTVSLFVGMKVFTLPANQTLVFTLVAKAMLDKAPHYSLNCKGIGYRCG